MDIYDQATEQEEAMRERAIAAARNSNPTLQANGRCHNCLVDMKQSAACFCDSDCRDDWQARNPNK